MLRGELVLDKIEPWEEIVLYWCCSLHMCAITDWQQLK